MFYFAAISVSPKKFTDNTTKTMVVIYADVAKRGKKVIAKRVETN